MGVVYQRRCISFEGGVHAAEVACHSRGFIFKWEFSGEARLMALHQCTSTSLVCLWPFSVNAKFSAPRGSRSVMHSELRVFMAALLWMALTKCSPSSVGICSLTRPDAAHFPDSHRAFCDNEWTPSMLRSDGYGHHQALLQTRTVHEVGRYSVFFRLFSQLPKPQFKQKWGGRSH